MVNKSNSKAILAKGYGLSLLVASSVLAALLWRWQVAGTPTPPALSAARFTVAVMSGPKQAAQTAPENTETVAEAVTPTQEKVDAPPVTAQRDTSLPDAVKAAQQAAPSPEVTKPVDVIPPAQVSMPGGQLMAEDASIGDDVPNPFEIKPRQVLIRLAVDANGKVTRFGIIRGGGDPMRDNLILKAMRSRKYDTSKMVRVSGNEPTWQIDLVIDYGNNDFLP